MKLRNIIKNDIYDDFDYCTNGKVQIIKKDTEDRLYMSMHKLGPPSFLKKNFKVETIKKYKIVNGKYFGC